MHGKKKKKENSFHRERTESIAKSISKKNFFIKEKYETRDTFFILPNNVFL